MSSLLQPPPADPLVARLRAGDEAAFSELVARHSSAMLRVALMYVPSRSVAEEVVQETWLGVVHGLDRFEERSSLRTWLFSILVNRARKRGERERRTIPFATLAARELSDSFAAVDPERFLPADHDRWPHHWATPPRRWEDSPEQALETGETLALIRAAIARLAPMQRLVITLRDLEGWDGSEVCNALAISETNQRVLLHRARARVRSALEEHLAA